jgi:hypothetical protein
VTIARPFRTDRVARKASGSVVLDAGSFVPTPIGDARPRAATLPPVRRKSSVDDRHIAMVSTGQLPIRDPRVDPRLP